MKEMTIPPAAVRDPGSLEMLRVWIAEHQLQCAVKVGVYKDKTKIQEARAWGIILADVTRHISMAMESAYSEDPAEVIRNISDSYLRELAKPTSKVDGEFVKPLVEIAD